MRERTCQPQASRPAHTLHYSDVKGIAAFDKIAVRSNVVASGKGPPTTSIR
jgi:hypothetical protein